MSTESEYNKLRFVKLSENAQAPVRGSEGSVGYDLSSAYGYVIPPGERLLAKTDLKMSIPMDCYARIAPRSGLSWKHSIDIGAGVIDPDYRGDVRVLLINNSNNEYEVNQGDRIAQLILERVHVIETEEVEDLDSTERGSGGFGSTGK